MSNVIPFDDQQHEDDKVLSWRIMNVINKQTGGEIFELKDEYGYVFGLIRDGRFFINIEQTDLGVDNE